MDTLTEFLSSKEVFIVIIVAVAICVIGTIYFVIEKIYKSKKSIQTNDMENKIVRVSENRIVVEPAVEETTPIEKEKVTIPDKVAAKQEATSNVIEIKEKKQEVIPKVVEVKEEKPPVIPIEEFEKQRKIETPKEVIEELIIPTVESIYTEVKEQVEKEKIEELVYTEIEPNKDEAKAELKKVTEELLKNQEMQQQENIDLTKFEEEQEENAIISMDELMQKSKVLYEQNETIQYEDEGNEPISLTDLEMRMNQIKIEAEKLEQEDEKLEVIKSTTEDNVKVKLDDFNTVSLHEAYKEDRVFKSSPVISPIFGIEQEPTTSNIELENTANYEKFDDEIKKTNEFLAVLRDLQKKLD